MPLGRLMLFIPMYNCEPQIPRVIEQLTPELQRRFSLVLVLDNGSTDRSVEVALEVGEGLEHVEVRVCRNQDNYGLGGSHKVAFQLCLDEGYDGLVVFHGDDQGRLADLMYRLDGYPDVECVLGARFMPGSQLKGYALHRILANLVFNGLFSVISLQMLWDLGSGLNYYSNRFLQRELWLGCADDLTFNYHLILRTAASGASVAFVPISWREEDQVSNARLLAHGREMLRIVVLYTLRRHSALQSDFSMTSDRACMRVDS